MTTKMEENAAAPATATDEQPKATKKASRAPQRAHVAPKKGKSGKKATSTKKAPKTPKGQKKPAVRDGSKTERILDLLKRKDGATLAEIMKATDWQPHSVRGRGDRVLLLPPDFGPVSCHQMPTAANWRRFHRLLRFPAESTCFPGAPE